MRGFAAGDRGGGGGDFKGDCLDCLDLERLSGGGGAPYSAMRCIVEELDERGRPGSIAELEGEVGSGSELEVESESTFKILLDVGEAATVVVVVCVGVGDGQETVVVRVVVSRIPRLPRP